MSTQVGEGARARRAERGGSGEPLRMRAVVQRRYGAVPQDVLQVDEVAVPAVARRDVLVRVDAAGVDRGTWHLMAGLPRVMRYVGFGVRGPRSRVPGLDVAGTVVAVGPEVTTLVPGQEVFGTAKGSFAQYVRAAEERLVPRPSNVTAVQAAVVPVSATAALQAVRDKGRVRPGQRVLVIGASGGVGLYAVQIARASGAEVTGVASGSKADLVRAAGADRVVDYERHDLADLAGEFDVVVDIAGNRQLSVLRRLLTPTGTLVITGGEHNGAWFGGIGRNMRAQLLSPFVRQRLVAFVSRLRHADLVTLAAMLEDGRLVPNVDRTFALTSAADAVSYLAEGRARGKVAVTV